MDRKKLLGDLWDLLEPVVVSEGMELLEIEFQREPRGWVLRLYIDKEGGVKLKDCTSISRQIGDLLDVKDPIDHPYTLEVSSPGAERPLRKPSDFSRFCGRMVRVTPNWPIKGRKTLTGILKAVEEGKVVLDLPQQGAVEVPLDGIRKARLLQKGED